MTITPFFFYKLRILLASAALLTCFAAPTFAQQALTPDQRKAVEALVREVLVKNPEIIQEALAELDKRNAQGQAEAQAQALCMLTEDFGRAYRAFLAKSKPVFEGN